ncbi:DUF4476 domain-containing protein [Hyalangium rubrum]|uniref:DUF4476 domain-containing protein n=1 Tax=Hyalangium rubrum TaxID=3103134 RepID=A0ABU5H5K7_9BACT|nr:DUF4476 domain-containing protein [Hyalangium sp. s54d21]MDY7228369.1 DUF4476 domain-containing protein [Hyalangium sp. s54d21]
MRALVVAVAVLMSAAASAQSPSQAQAAQAQSQDLKRAPPPGQPTGPVAPPSSTPNYGPGYNGPSDSFRHEGTLVVVERERMAERLAQMERLLERALERAERGQGRTNLLKLGDELDAMRDALNNAPDVRRYQPRPQPPPPPPAPTPMVQPITEDQLQKLTKSINRESFGDGKLRVLESAASQQYFLVPQVLKLLQRFTFSGDRMQAMRVLWPRVLDRENAYQLYGAFSFPSEKEELRKIIGN